MSSFITVSAKLQEERFSVGLCLALSSAATYTKDETELGTRVELAVGPVTELGSDLLQAQGPGLLMSIARSLRM
jgi:hypothetical protein